MQVIGQGHMVIQCCFLIDWKAIGIKLEIFVAIVAQLVRAPACGAGGRRFESGLSPHFDKID